MNATCATTNVVKAAPRWSAFINGLLAQPRDRWATGRNRGIRIVLTATLLVTGVSAWALALVQPWAGPRGYDTRATAAVIDLQKMQDMVAGLESVCSINLPPAQAPGRNPFVPTVAMMTVGHPAAATTAIEKHVATPVTTEKTVRPVASPAAKTLLESVKTLRLEATLVSPGAQRWAVINGAEYHEGETVSGFQILEIQEGKVKLQQAGILCLLRME
jgi:hypothetical protein